MRAMTLPMFLVAACLLAAPWRAQARSSASPTQSTPPVSSVHDRAPKQPVAWSSLSPEQQHMLAPVQNQWDKLRPARQQHLANNARHWSSLPPQHQQQIRERLTRWAQMTQEQRRQLREKARAFQKLTPDERAKVREAFKKFQSLPPAQRRALRERWRTMSPDERKHWVTEHPNGPIPARPPAHSGH